MSDKVYGNISLCDRCNVAKQTWDKKGNYHKYCKACEREIKKAEKGKEMRIILDISILPTMEISYPRSGGVRSEYLLCGESDTIEITDKELDEISDTYWGRRGTYKETSDDMEFSEYLNKLIELKIAEKEKNG